MNKYRIKKLKTRGAKYLKLNQILAQNITKIKEYIYVTCTYICIHYLYAYRYVKYMDRA